MNTICFCKALTDLIKENKKMPLLSDQEIYLYPFEFDG